MSQRLPQPSLSILGNLEDPKYLEEEEFFSLKEDTDRTFGIYEKEGKKYIGNQQFVYDSDNEYFIIGDKKYKATDGLWELITSKNPNSDVYSAKDYLEYVKILKQTSVLHHNNNPNSPYPKANKGNKWKFVKPIWEKLTRTREEAEGSSRPVSPAPTEETGARPKTSEPTQETEKKQLVDKIYGLKKNNTGDIIIGDEIIKIDNNKIFVGNKGYKNTIGLRNLIQYENPSEKTYNKQDLENYLDIMVGTKAIFKDLSSSFEPKTYKGYKWEKIFSPNLNKIDELIKLHNIKIGSGWRKKKTTMVIPSDPNSLLERLDVLMASKKAGNTGVRNELVSICDELKRQHVLNIKSYKKLMSIL